MPALAQNGCCCRWGSWRRERWDHLLKDGQFTQSPRCGSASVASKKCQYTALVIPIPFSSPQGWSDHRLLTALTCVRGAQCGSPPGWPQAGNILPSPIPFPHQRCSGKANAATRECGRPPCAESSSWEVPSSCGSAVLLFAFLVQLRNVSSPQKNQPEEHLYHVPVLCTTLLMALPNRRTLFYLKPQYFPPARQDTQLPPAFTSKPLFKQTEVAAIYLAHKHTLLYTQQESKLQKHSANEEIQTMMSAALKRHNCPNRSELDPPLLHMRAPTNSYNF